MSWAANRHRTVRKELIFTPEEWELAWSLYEKTSRGSGSTSFAAHARRMLTEGTVTQVVYAFDPGQLRGEIRRIGSNINQIAHQANTADTLTREMAAQAVEQHEKLWELFLKMSRDPALPARDK